MATRIKSGDQVKVISGAKKGTTGKVLSVSPRKNSALIEGIGTRTRHVKPTQLNPVGGKREVQVAIPLHKLALVADEKTGKTSRVGFVKNADGDKVRLARQLKNKEIK